MSKTKCVYVVSCSETGNRYVGSTKDYAHRKRCHLYDLRHRRNWIEQMQEDFDVYGEESFSFEILAKTDRDEWLADMETFWIGRLSPEYNKVLVGGKYASPQFLNRESQLKSAASRIGIKQSKEWIDKRVSTMIKNGKQKLKTVSPEQRAHLSEINTGENNPNWGMKRTAEHKKILLDSLTKTVYTFVSPDGEVVVTRNLTQYCRDNDINYHTLRGAINSPNHTQRGWRFIKKERIV